MSTLCNLYLFLQLLVPLFHGVVSLEITGTVKSAMCRATCLAEFTNTTANPSMSNNQGCTTDSNWRCNMCWDYCGSLADFESSHPQMCGDDICLAGCKHACDFFASKAARRMKGVELPRKAGIRNFGKQIFWTHPLMATEKVVIIVYGKTLNRTWGNVLQTTEQRLKIPTIYKKLKFVVVSSREMEKSPEIFAKYM